MRLNPDFRDWNIEEFLSGISIPALILQGEEDQYGTPAQVDAIERGIERMPKRVLFLTGKHSPHLEQPDVTLMLIKGFVENLG